ncbi:MAG: hypothetical protein AB8B65_17210 [Kordia sp.]|uniref:hypothetical protein n=1 Tax=Kordia sp. TaxID=1965332 RepID=UPI00385D5AEF
MLKQIKNIQGVKQLSKQAQQNFKGGFGNYSATCQGVQIIVNTETCPSSHPFMHPAGHCICCSGRWRIEK